MMWRAAFTILFLLVAGLWTSARGETPCGPKNVLAIRLASYYEAQDEALAHAASCGFKYVFMSVPRPDQVAATQEGLAKHGLKVAVLRGEADLGQESAIDILAEQLATCERMGVRYLFLSPKYTAAPRGVVIERLRRLGPVAEKHGVIVGLETHPPLGANGTMHVRTMKAIDHPNIRVNFDTANITYYNRGASAVDELAKCIDYVGTVEIKDHSGQFETWNFPPPGRGVVDIPGVLRALRRHGYTGPITIEVEGVEGVKRTKAQIKRDIAESARYLRRLGWFE